ncbi:saccharopine dehydrogenase [Anopheles sinensis]|uniref:Saccharopine dehydrogenase n=1 Tax=Anopheles sinensis TaxID=74873 RepID=A0A084VBM7_ANOSI|nr:saccharopine dehydrogenase [Anopheles sinensis]
MRYNACTLHKQNDRMEVFPGVCFSTRLVQSMAGKETMCAMHPKYVKVFQMGQREKEFHVSFKKQPFVKCSAHSMWMTNIVA